MNDKNECIILGPSTMEKREGAPGLPTEGRASVGPATTLQISQNEEAEPVERMDTSPDAAVQPSVKIERLESSPARQKSPSYLNQQIRTNMSVVSNCVVSSPTKMIRSPGVGPSTGVSTLCDSGSSTSQASANSLNPQCNVTFAMSKKRLKISDSSERVTASDEVLGIRKRILEHKLARLKSIRERHNENAAELFYLESGGNMMDYQAWRKRPPTPQLLSFIRSHSFEKAEESTEQDPNRNVPHTAPRGAEIKIPGIGATPIAISTTLPAAVTQLTQQGSVPGRPAGGRHGMVFASHRNQTTIATPRLPGGTPLIIENAGVSRLSSNHTASPTTLQATSSQEQIVEKAKQEAQVMQRIAELQKEGLWTEKRLPKVVEPSRPKAHWDYLLEEMVWLATDFAQERKWKKAAAKKCARMIQKYFQEKELSSQRAEKAQEHQLRRIASFIAKEVRSFWINVEKLVEYRQQTRLEEKRKQALDQQLNFIVDQTEKYSQQLAEGLRTQNPASKQSSSKASSVTVQSDGEFCPSDAGSSDDEETIAAAEREETEDSSRKEELEALQRESQMDLDEFLNELPQDYLENRDKICLSDNEESDTSDKKGEDSEFQADGDSTDDEDTIMEQEKLENKNDYEKEIDELNAENEMSIEELKKKYSAPPPTDDAEPADSEESLQKSTDKSEKVPDSEKDADNDIEVEDDEESMSESEDSIMSDNTEDEESEGLDALMNEGDASEKQTNDDHRMEDAAAIAESIQPTGNTLSSTQVVTKVPFLLKHSLREYQHIGLDWLVTMEQRRLNGILADEMGLGKTIQTIALLAHLACEKGDWGPHLIIVPTSVMLNWEMEFKKWCPGFKILTYYGNQKERKLKRIGWTKFNAFHICITSYKLVIQDHQSFRRKKWKYLILDEAQNIKNFKSQRWQLLLNFKTQQRLLLTGTPLQNNLMELWSLMHFLMPDIFASHNEFKEWFSNPVTGMIEGNSEYNENVIKRLHKVLRPFLLRRLKSEVEKQMPKKYEHVVICRLSKRQRFLYDDFMSRAKTKETLASGNLLSVINVLMQLRKVCNHPNLFEVRPTISPFQMEGINYHLPSEICNMKKHDPLTDIDFAAYNLNFLDLENISAFESYRVQQLKINEEHVTKVDSSLPLPPPCPRAALRIHVTLRPVPMTSRSSNKGVAVGTSPRMPPSTVTNIHNSQQSLSKHCVKLPTIIKKENTLNPVPSETSSPHTVSVVQPLTARVLKQLSSARTSLPSSAKIHTEPVEKKRRSEFYDDSIEQLLKNKRKSLLNFIYETNEKRCEAYPIYGSDLRDACTVPKLKFCDFVQKDVNTVESYMRKLSDVLDRFIIYICGAMSSGIRLHVGKGAAWRTQEEKQIETHITTAAKPLFKLVSRVTSNMTTQFPDPRLIQYDCGKLQTLDLILRKLKSENHKVLIFTQMTKMLDVLEAFLNFHGHIYLRLDGTTRIEQRQILMERFNADKRIFAFILSTRSGGVGVNLTGADTVIFYDSDWNPTMDAQAQDRCHRIGQTRDVHIYRLISEKTIEENILKKANQKRMLGDVAIEGGNFTTAYFKSSTIQDLFTVGSDEDAGKRMEVVVSQDDTPPEVPKVSELVEDRVAFESALAECEDEADVAAATTARAEADAELAEFDESIPIEEPANSAPEPPPELTKAEQELEQLMQELSPIERYGIRLVEASEAAAFAEQQAIAEMEKQKRDWETARRLLERSPSPMEPELNNDDLLTFSREDSINQVWISANTNEIMTVWYPPTPPQGEGDIYIDSSLAYLYDWNIMLESQLPPVYVKRDNKRPRAEMGHSPDSRRPSKSHRREETVYTPRSLFERPTPALIKMRRDLKLQKYRNIMRPTMPIPGITKLNPKSQGEPEFVLEWTLLEDKCLLEAVKSQGLPLNLINLSPAHTHNWFLVSDLVNNYSRIYRSYRQCKYRYETVILPREEGKLMDANQKKQKKSKSSHKSNRLLRTSHLYEQDNNVSFTKDFIARYDVMKVVFNKKTISTKRRYDDPNIKNPKHVAVLSDSGINYDKPSNPMDIAQKRADRIAKEKSKSLPTTSTVTNEQAVAPTRLQNVTKVTSSPPLGTSSPLHGTAAAPSPRPPQRVLQADPIQRQQRIVVTPQQGTSAIVKGNATGTLTTGGKPLNSAQLQYYRHQAAIRQQLKVFPHTGTQQGNIVQQISVSQQGNKISPVTVTSIQVSAPQQRPQITQATIGKQTITRTVENFDISTLIKRQQQQKLNALQQPITQIFASQQQLQTLQAGNSERVAVTVGGTATVAVATGNVAVASPGTKIAGAGILTGVTTSIPAKTSMKMATPQQIRQLQLQPLTLAQRKGPKVTQLAQVGGGAQVIVQAPGTHKTLPSGMTMQQIQQVMRQFPPTNTRVVPRQTIQVVGGSVGQVRTAGTSAGHQVILSQVSAALQARQPAPASTPMPTATVRPAVHPQPPPADPQPKT